MEDKTTMNIVPEGRERDADLHTLAEYVMRQLFTWAMPADWGVNMGIARNQPAKHGQNDGRWEKTLSSSEEVLSVLGPEPDDDGDWSPDLHNYARDLWLSLGQYVREGCVIASYPPPAPEDWGCDERGDYHTSGVNERGSWSLSVERHDSRWRIYVGNLESDDGPYLYPKPALARAVEILEKVTL